jgi:hypothetical protein
MVGRVFHIPLAIVHPSCGWARVVSPSLVTIEKPSIFSSHSNDLHCICIHPGPLSSRGQGPVRAPSDKEILVLESVTRGGWLAISGFGSGSHRTFSSGVIFGEISSSNRVLGCTLSHVSSRRLTRTSGQEGTWSVESSCHLVWMKIEMTGWRKRATGLPRSLSLSDRTSCTSTVTGKPAWAVVSHTVWSPRDCCVVSSDRTSFRVMKVGSLPGPPTLLGSDDTHR